MKKYIFTIFDKRIKKQIITLDELLKRVYPNLTVEKNGEFSFNTEDYEIKIEER